MSRTLEVANGRVRGVSEDGVVVFRGIPFAAPPTGRLRFRPPAGVVPWSGVREASTPGPQCPQNSGPITTLLGGTDARQDEDCLYLNVWVPDHDVRKRPVLLWIHGGAFEIGAGSQPIYDGARLARRGDLIVVSINYRLGIFGRLDLHALGGESLDTTANAATLDQLAALDWVRANIGAFGGDPDQITLFGESAGSMSIATLLATPAARGKFQRAILQSGAANFVSTREHAAQMAHQLVAHDVVAHGQLDRLWSLSTAELLKVQAKAFPRFTGGGVGLPFQPIVDGTVLPKPPLDAITDGTAAKVQLLVGTNLEEMKLFGLFDPAFGSLDEPGLMRRCERALGSDAGRAIEVYRQARSARGDAVTPTELWYAIDSDRTFRAPAMALAQWQRTHQADVYAYLFTWRSPLLGGRLGAGHAVELPFVFGTLEEPMLAQFAGQGPDATGLSLAMQDAWIQFAHTGRPGHPHLPTWTPYDADTRATMLLGGTRDLVPAPREPERRFWESLA